MAHKKVIKEVKRIGSSIKRGAKKAIKPFVTAHRRAKAGKAREIQLFKQRRGILSPAQRRERLKSKGK